MLFTRSRPALFVWADGRASILLLPVCLEMVVLPVRGVSPAHPTGRARFVRRGPSGADYPIYEEEADGAR